MRLQRLTRNLVSVVLVGATSLWTHDLLAWSTISCPSQSQYRIAYPNDDVWPLRFAGNMPVGGSPQNAILEAMENWNAVYGALDTMDKAGDGYQYCDANDNAGFGVVGWDDGTCTDWAPGQTGVHIYWSDDCTITKSTVYFNANHSFTYNDLLSCATHELGHYQYYDHNWYQVSIMGYTYANTPPMTFLTAPDQQYLRSIFTSSNTAGPDLHIHRYALVDHIVEDSISYEKTDEPTCTHGCGDLRGGDTIRVKLTFGNAGGSSTGEQVGLGMYLDNYKIGGWTTSGELPAGSQGTDVFEATVPSGIPAGLYDLEVGIDPDNSIAEIGGPSAANRVVFYGFRLLAPSDWDCPVDQYDANDGCNCNCGAYDPDCDVSSSVVYNCTNSNPCKSVGCSSSGQCITTNNTTSCDDGDFCTVDDRCTYGVCKGESLRDCSYLDGMCERGVCNEAADACTPEARTDGTPCDDAEVCTSGDVCSAGQCSGAPVTCPPSWDPCFESTCDDQTGQCALIPSQGDECGAQPGDVDAGSGGGGVVSPGEGGGNPEAEPFLPEESSDNHGSSSDDGLSSDGGCGCGVPATPISPWKGLLFALALLAIRRRTTSN